MQALCIGRHPYLSEHYARFFAALGIPTVPVVGLDEALRVAHAVSPSLVLCEYDLFATLSLDEWEQHPVLAYVPTVAVSLTRRPNEANLLDVNGIAGFLYLPTLRRDDARRILGAACPAGFSLRSPFLAPDHSASALPR